MKFLGRDKFDKESSGSGRMLTARRYLGIVHDVIFLLRKSTDTIFNQHSFLSAYRPPTRGTRMQNVSKDIKNWKGEVIKEGTALDSTRPT